MTWLASFLPPSLLAAARTLVLAGALAGCGGSAGKPAPVVPAEGQFVWTVEGTTVMANDSYMVDGHKGAGYNFTSEGTHTLFSIMATTEQSFDCWLGTHGSTLPAPGRYPKDKAGEGTFGVLCNDPTSPITDNNLAVTEGEVVITKAEPGDLEGTFKVSGPTDAAVGGFNVGCLYVDCMSPS